MHTRQRRHCLPLDWKQKKQFYGNLDIKDVTDNNKFCKRIKQLFLEKKSNKIIIDNDMSRKKKGGN